MDLRDKAQVIKDNRMIEQIELNVKLIRSYLSEEEKQSGSKTLKLIESALESLKEASKLINEV